METDFLSKLPELPSYKSCIKNYGRSILPPLILPPDREKLEDYRSKASTVEARIIAKKTVNDSFMETLKKLADCAFSQQAVQATQNISIGDCLLSPESKQQSSSYAAASTSPSLALDLSPTLCNVSSFRKRIYYEEVVDHDTSSSSINSDLAKQMSNDFAIQCNLMEKSEYVVYRNEEDLVSSNGYCSQISEDKTLSEVEENTEWSTSLPTVILKKSSRDDDESGSVTSVNRSTDLDKYLDSPIDAETPTKFGEKKEVFSNLESSTSGSTATLVSISRSSSPVIQPPSKSEDSDKNTLQCAVATSSQSTLVINALTTDFSDPTTTNIEFLIESDATPPGKHKDAVEETGSQKSWLKKLLDKAQKVPKNETKETSKSDGDNDADTETSFRRQHLRSNSYTLESPSPCLVLSHNGCRCEHSPESVPSPHCRSVPSDTDTAELNTKVSEKSHSSNVNDHDAVGQMSKAGLKDKTSSPSSVVYNNIPHINPNGNDTVDNDVTGNVFNEVSPASKPDSENCISIRTSPKSSEEKFDPDFRHDIPIQDVYNMFLAIREKTFNDMHRDHVKQWKELSDNFERKDRLFQERLAFLNLNDPSAKALLETSPSSVSVASTKSQQPPRAYQHVVSMPISSVRSFIANNNSPKSGCPKKDIESVLNNPTMQKKFEKVSAAVKGYLTRRLWNSNVVQAIVAALKDCAQGIADIKYEVVKRGGVPTEQDLLKHQKLFNQIKEIDAELQRIFFEMSVKERMELIADTREANRQKAKSMPPQIFLPMTFNEPRKFKEPSVPLHMRKLSSATLKALERKQLGTTAESKFHSNPELQVSRKPLNTRPHARRRILSPRSCTVSPPLGRNFKKSSPGKRSSGVNKARRSLY